MDAYEFLKDRYCYSCIESDPCLLVLKCFSKHGASTENWKAGCSLNSSQVVGLIHGYHFDGASQSLPFPLTISSIQSLFWPSFLHHYLTDHLLLPIPATRPYCLLESLLHTAYVKCPSINYKSLFCSKKSADCTGHIPFYYIYIFIIPPSSLFLRDIWNSWLICFGLSPLYLWIQIFKRTQVAPK